MRVGIFGGSFDPVHLGHLWIAEAAVEALGLDELRWIPAAQSPLKPGGPVASQQARLQMVQLAVSGCEKYRVDDRELRRGEVSYTVDTVAELRDEMPDAELCLIIGSDSLASFRQWHQPERLLQLVQLAVVQRGGEPDIDFSVLEGLADRERIDRMHDNLIKMPVIEISSSGIRTRIGQSKSIRFQVPRPVEALIKSQNLYEVDRKA